ncbi:tyrosine-protein phosphatase [Klebsiella aerogenes]|uniref:tyrosine-protein phosphatase n=1 Tax=Klebsiella aerogenes TaxID=548 RepID=UPI000F4FAB7B|nr:tyrosine-protein phosphatase [Klebsiella aerogenes]AYY01452.1 protein tyrosine phosphatase [Klebsiella aerogenes]
MELLIKKGIYSCVKWLMLLISLTAGLSAAASENMPDNFYRVTPELYRSAQPIHLQMQSLDRIGIRSVLNLRQWHSDADEAKGTGLILYRVPMNAAAINNDDVVIALSFLHRAAKPALVHCWHGSDRTGMIVALYQLLFSHATKSEVLSELRRPEYGYHQQFYPDIARYIAAINVEELRARVLSLSAGKL